ncbi:peptide/nickel transport system substrate-binding protein [Cryobacterium mesophilum]|uniref:Peptide ABC transporter substrate-binding protein n=1 Tax=Terrimesophilobacter mesophilus TaxID=433647 RepID=A0A4R8V9R6_9MICO|nr:ABC transporter substrate-binding protein [Terrimesophilobacter mesophilus]MBB5632232.1 peptide/nickel transport system substrate-binding protein [Terrimesophilobacter mesophilus]TFB79086.1 peptide ABC transporter substrate-binding protein [Terrimesophilobacter mesophilus]
MTSASTIRKRSLAVLSGVAIAAMALSGCAAGNGTGNTGASGTITVGTTDKVTTLDPAGSYDNGSFFIMNNVFPFLMNSNPGSSDVHPDIAESASFTAPTEYTVKLKPGLKWANGHDLTASDVKFSFDRQLKIAADNGPSTLLYNLDSTEVKDDLTVVFHLKAANDQIWPQILSSPAAPIVDEEVFSPTALTTDQEIVDGNAFAGPYVISSYKFNELVQFKAYDGYQGLLGKPKTATINLKYYADQSNMKLDVQEGNIDVATRSLSATDIDSLASNKDVTVHKGPGGEIRYIVFNFDTMPFGAKTADADAAKSLAVRQAIADLIDRDAIASQVYKGTYLPLYSYVPAGLTGATDVLKSLYGDGNGGPDADKAKATLEAAGVTGPVTLNLQYNPDHYGASSGDEYALVKSQLEASGLFTVNLQSTEWVQYSKDRSADVYPMYQLGWFPDYSDADNYLSPFFQTDNFLKNHFSNAEIDSLIKAQAVETDPAKRKSEIEDIQAKVAAQLSTLPLLQGAQVVVSGKDVKGVDDTLDASFKFRFNVLSK